jgi:hypothetical protein
MHHQQQQQQYPQTNIPQSLPEATVTIYSIEEASHY